MLNLREFYSIITKPVDTGKGVVILLPDRTIVFNEFNNISTEIDKVFHEGDVPLLAFYIQDLKGLITSVDEKLLKGEAKPDIIIPIEKLYPFNIDGIHPLLNIYQNVKSYNILKHEEEFNSNLKEQILAAKASGGMYKYIINTADENYLMMIYKGLINMAKPDIVKVRILENANYPDFFLGEFTTFKKKDKFSLTTRIGFLKIPLMNYLSAQV